jgi:hypothetical protein
MLVGGKMGEDDSCFRIGLAGSMLDLICGPHFSMRNSDT